MSKHKNFSRRALVCISTRTHLEGHRSVDLSNSFVGIWRPTIGTDIVPHGIVFVKNMKPVSRMVEKRGYGDASSLLQP